MYNDFKYVVTEEDEKEQLKIKDYLRKKFEFSSRLITKIKKNHGIFLNGNDVPGWVVPVAGEVITVKTPVEKSNFEPDDIPINVIFEDKDLLIIDKQPGVIVHPTQSHPRGTIANGIMKYIKDTGQVFKLRFVNRLDRDTSGLLVLGKNSHCQDKISKQMKENIVEKKYIALVHGIIPESEGTIDLPIGRPGEVGIKRKVMKDGSPCVTHYRVLEHYFPDDKNPHNPINRDALDQGIFDNYLKNHEQFLEENPDKKELYDYLSQNDEPNQVIHHSGFTLVELRLETGRTHQIRVHLSFMGYPIVGDTLYGTASDVIGRQALHAYSLHLNHPVTEKTLELTAPIPNDIENAIKLVSANKSKY